MQVLGFPGCCTAKVMVGFGEERNASVGTGGITYTLETMKLEVHKLLTGYQAGTNNGIITAALTSRQKMGIQALTDLGWSNSGKKEKDGHSETDLLLFFINPKEYAASEIAKGFAKTAVEQQAAVYAEQARIEAERRALRQMLPTTPQWGRTPEMSQEVLEHRLQRINATTAHLAEGVRRYMLAHPDRSHHRAIAYIKGLARRRWVRNFGSRAPACLQ